MRAFPRFPVGSPVPVPESSGLPWTIALDICPAHYIGPIFRHADEKPARLPKGGIARRRVAQRGTQWKREKVVKEGNDLFGKVWKKSLDRKALTTGIDGKF